MHTSYSNLHHSEDEFLLFKMVCRLSWKPLLVKVPMQQKGQTPADSNSTSWLRAVKRVIQRGAELFLSWEIMKET